MGRSPCCDETGLKKGPWTLEEDQKLVDHIQKHGHGSWRALPKLAGLNRCGKSCRLRWTNLRPDIKRGKFSPEEEHTILNLHSVLSNKWSAIATHLPGRTDNEIKNFWNTHLKKKLIQMGLDPVTHCPRTDFLAALPALLAIANNLRELADGRRAWDDRSARLQAEAVQATELQHLLQSAAAPQGGSPAPSSIDNNLEFNSDIAHRDDEYLLLLLLLQSELQNPSRHDHHQPALSNHEASQMISSSCLASLPRSRTLVSLPPLTGHRASVANLSGDACSTSSCGGSPGTSSFVWPDLLLGDPFMNEFA